MNKKQKQLQQILMKNHAICKPKTFYILLVFSLITVVLLIAVSIYCYLVKYQAKKIHLLPYYISNDKLEI